MKNISAATLATLIVVFTTALATFMIPTLARAQAKSDLRATFETKKISLGRKILTVEIADDGERRAQGLMFREKLEGEHGMLFIFDGEEPLAFWMKNTLIPLAIGYFDQEKKLVDIHEMVPAVAGEANPKTYTSKKPAMYALEMPKGWFSRNKVVLGAKFSFKEDKSASH
jgi:uncharacterized membrane protein (UPF0127 family)